MEYLIVTMLKRIPVAEGRESTFQKFCHATQNLNQLTALFTIIPPPSHHTPEQVQQRAHGVARALHHLPLNALNIPEVLNETRNGPRVSQYTPKVPPRAYAQVLRRAYREICSSAPEMIVNRVVVRHPAPLLQKWFWRTHNEFNIFSFLLVGGESSQIPYPGPTVPESARLLQRIGFSHIVGGITIPTRRHSEPSRDEPQRMVKKMKSGISFFTSQILFEPSSVCRLLADFAELCLQEKSQPAKIFLSFAPVAREKDLRFLRWLGVVVPDEIAKYLTENPKLTEERSILFAETLFQSILDWSYSFGIPVPMGLNVEHVMSYNLDISAELTHRLLSLANRHPLFSK